MIWAAFAVLVLTTAGSSVAAAAKNCDRACLKGYVDEFLGALLQHDPSSLPKAPQFNAIFNGKLATPEDDIWKVVDEISFHQYVLDPSTGQAGFFGVAVENHQRGTFFLRLAVKDGKLTETETIAGERTPDGVPGLISPNPFFDYVLPPAQRRTRPQLIAIADGYFEGLERHDGKNVPVSADCRRFEGGVQTSLNPVFLPLACNDFSPFTYIDKTANRLYPIVDVERGLVLGQMVIQASKGAVPGRPLQVSPVTGMVPPPNPMRSKPHDTIIHELFKIVDGKITEIQVIRLDRPCLSGGGW
jgi:hypothetical protein